MAGPAPLRCAVPLASAVTRPRPLYVMGSPGASTTSRALGATTRTVSVRAVPPEAVEVPGGAACVEDDPEPWSTLQRDVERLAVVHVVPSKLSNTAPCQ